ncbi:MAG: septum formation protein Maf, partial [Chloroflexota bacterium]
VEDPKSYVIRMAESKARAIAGQVHPDSLVIGADTAVVDSTAEIGAQILGKPASALEAVEMLQRLRNRTHQVYTALAVLRVIDGSMVTDMCSTDVAMRNYTDEEILAYVASGDPLDKAGAYAIQHEGFHPVENVAGCYANVVGLPVCSLTYVLSNLGMPPRADIARACQADLRYPCPIYQNILRGEE